MPGPAVETVRDVFCKIIDLAPEQRAAARDALCGGDTALAARVQALLDAHSRAQDFLDQTLAPVDTDAGASGASPPPIETSAAPATIGPYTLLKLIGEGGLGSVYLAAQERPIRRRVALKVIKRGMETRQLIARFAMERQAMALMDHPGIARVFDAGETDAGVPYFAMEFIDGLPITRYCDEKQLTVVQRLGLFVQVCSAIQHAHQKGVIHRDIKPSNVLVATADDKPVPKVIDFGIAKAAESVSMEHVTLTGAQQMLGTPLYMSPEQVARTQGGVDTRSDIYSLGVLLYELLTGETPFDSSALDSDVPWEMQRVICQVEPPPPSARISKIAGVSTVAADRRTDPTKLRGLLRGDLDWVVMKAIAKDRERRYETAGSLGADITRHLQYEPVNAGPPGLRYRVRRFAIRYRLPLAIAGAVAASLLIGLGATTVGLVRAVRAERAEAREKSAAVDELWNSRLLQARAGRWSRQPGQRFEGLRVIAAAAKVRQALALRNEAIGCMALSDVEPVGAVWDEHRGDPMPFRFDSSMTRYLAWSNQRKITIYRTSDRQALVTLPDFGKVSYASFSRNGRFLEVTSPSNDIGLRVWDLDECRPVLQLRGPLESASAIDFVGEGTSIAVGEAGGKIAVYDLPAGARSATISTGGAISLLKAQPRGKIIAAWGADKGLQIISLESDRLLSATQLNLGPLTRMCWHPDGRRMGVCVDNRLNEMYLLDSLTGEVISVMRGHLGPPQRMQFSPDGQVFASGAFDGTLRMWSVSSGTGLLRTTDFGEMIQVSDDGLLMATRGASYSHLLRTAISRECRHIGIRPSEGEFRSGDFSDDGSVLAGAIGAGVRTWKVESGEEIGFEPADGVRSVLFSPDKGLVMSVPGGIRRLALSSADRVVPPRDWRPDPGGTGALALSRDGRTAVYGTSDGRVFAADVTDFSKSIALGQHKDFARFVAVSPDGSWAASSTRFVNEFKVWDVKGHRPAVDLPCVSTIKETGPMAFSPDGRWLVTGEPDCYSWWEVGTWKLHHRVPRKDAAVGAQIAFSDTGKLLAVDGPGYTILLLDPNSGAELATLEDPEPHVSVWFVFSRDGSHFAAMNADKTATIWDLGLIRHELAEMKLDW